MKINLYGEEIKALEEKMLELYDEVVCDAPIRRMNISFNDVTGEENEQFDFFNSPEELDREKNMMRAINAVKDKYGKNSMLKAMNFEEGATTIERNEQIGGHKSG